jgi:hypothetical protein
MRAIGLRPFVALDGSTIPHWSRSHASRWGSAIAILERRSIRLLPDEVPDEVNAAAGPQLLDDDCDAHLSDFRPGGVRVAVAQIHMAR